TRFKRASSSSKVFKPKTRKSPRVCQKDQPRQGKQPRDDPNKPSPGPSGMAKKRKARMEEAEGESSDDETEDDEMMDEDGDKPRTSIKTLALQCTEPDCVEMVSDYDALHSHIANHHGLPLHRCLAPVCGLRFDNR